METFWSHWIIWLQWVSSPSRVLIHSSDQTVQSTTQVVWNERLMSLFWIIRSSDLRRKPVSFELISRRWYIWLINNYKLSFQSITDSPIVRQKKGKKYDLARTYNVSLSLLSGPHPTLFYAQTPTQTHKHTHKHTQTPTHQPTPKHLILPDHFQLLFFKISSSAVSFLTATASVNILW